MAELLGAIGVIASVMYLAYQINGDREAFGLSREGAIRINGFNLALLRQLETNLKM